MTPDPLALIARVEAGGASVDDVALALAAVEAHETRAKELRVLLEMALMEHLRAVGDIVIGDDRYYLGKASVTRCHDVKHAVESALETADGDVGRLTDCLRSDPFKVSAMRDLLPSALFDMAFRTTVGEELRIVKVSERFLKQARANRLAATSAASGGGNGASG